jgi:nickel-type superoxide dismutase maturation protease
VAKRVLVEGDSMRPTLEPGDRLLAIRARRIRAGQLVVVPDPRRPDRLLVKRVAAVGPAAVSVQGDNAGASTDSRQFGPVSRTAVVGRIVYRYAPLTRAGRVH